MENKKYNFLDEETLKNIEIEKPIENKEEKVKKEQFNQWLNKNEKVLNDWGFFKKNELAQIMIPITIFFIGLLIGGILMYGISNDSFKTELNQTIENNVSIKNDYTFSTPLSNSVNNQYKNNYTIINNIEIPSNLCNCS